MCELRRFIQEKILNDNTLHITERRFNVLGVGVRLGDIFTLDIHTHVFAGNCSVKHVGDSIARFVIQLHAPISFEDAPNLIISDRSIARQLMRERSHVTRPLHVVLTAQRVNAAARESDVAGGHGQISHAHDHR